MRKFCHTFPTLSGVMMFTHFAVAILLFIACASATASTNTIFINPAAAFTLTYNDPALTSSPISLASLGIFPGDVISLQEVGLEYYEYPQTNTTSSMDGIFSSSSVVLGSSVLHRVPGAIQTTLPAVVTLNTYNGNYSTDIPEDFGINAGVTVQVPTGASYLFVEPNSSYFSDNVSVNGTYGVEIYTVATVPEPGLMALCGLGLTAGIMLLRRRIA